MRHAKTLLTSVGLIWIGGSIALAAEPVAPVKSTQTTASPAPSAQSPPPDDAAVAAEDKTLREQGYKPEMRNGVKYYCRHEAPLGSRLEQTRCMTAEQSMDKRRQSKEMTERAQRMQTNPTKG